MDTDAKATTMEVEVDDTVEETAVDLSSEAKPKPSDEPEMLTKEQAEKLANERHSKLDKRLSELEKSGQTSLKRLEIAEARAKAAEESLAAAKIAAEESERAKFSDSPESLNLYDERVKNRRMQEALDAQKKAFQEEREQHTEELSELKTWKLEKLAGEIATEYGVDAGLLIKLTDGSRERMELLAKSLPKKEDKPTFQKPPKPDSGKASGKFGNPSVEQLNNMSMEDYAEYVKERDKKRK